jgi:hypothetical protein
VGAKKLPASPMPLAAGAALTAARAGVIDDTRAMARQAPVMGQRPHAHIRGLQPRRRTLTSRVLSMKRAMKRSKAFSCM